MFSKSAAKVLVHARTFASEVPETNKMDNLLKKLADITSSNSPSSNSSTTMMKKSSKKQFKNASNGEKREKKEFKSFNKRNNQRNRNTYNKNNNERRGLQNSSSFSNTRQTVSHYDKYKNAKKVNPSGSSPDSTILNTEGLSLAELQKEKALYIRRKENVQESIVPNTPDINVFNFVASRALHKSLIYDLKADKFAKFNDPLNKYTLTPVNKAELELIKDKLGYDTKSRLLRALEQITTKRGFKLLDANKTSVQYLPYNALLYPFANTTLPSNLQRPVANLKNLSNVSPDEITSTLATVVKGVRQELVFDANKNYKTTQLKVNAQVVANSLNRNSQLQVDNLHQTMAQVMVGEQPVKTLPQPILAPKKI
jgi:hypothetical protein